MLRIAQILFAACLGLAAAQLPARAAELVMIEQEFCEWCDRWNDEIGGIYAQTAEGKRAPLRRIQIHDPVPSDLEFSVRAHYTPTFVLVDNGVEVGRIEGYPGEHFFWPMLTRLLDRLPEETN